MFFQNSRPKCELYQTFKEESLILHKHGKGRKKHVFFETNFNLMPEPEKNTTRKGNYGVTRV